VEHKEKRAVVKQGQGAGQAEFLNIDAFDGCVCVRRPMSVEGMHLADGKKVFHFA